MSERHLPQHRPDCLVQKELLQENLWKPCAEPPILPPATRGLDKILEIHPCASTSGSVDSLHDKERPGLATAMLEAESIGAIVAAPKPWAHHARVWK